VKGSEKMTHRIVLTGGPGGGKSTAADLIRREVGESIVIVPESATLLFMGGFPRKQNEKVIRSTQRAIFHVQRSIEDIQHELYPDRTLLCDRGTIDGAVYWPGELENFFEYMGTSLEDEFKRYDAVIFFETAAVGDISIEGGNPIRNENNTQAIELDHRLRDLWSRHSQYIHIAHENSFMKKLNNAINAYQSVVKNLNGTKKVGTHPKVIE
jgi:hypothetical protein